MPKKFIFFVFLGFLGLSFVLYGNTFPGEFVWDDVFFTQRIEFKDPAYLTKVWFEGVLPESPQANLYRPLTMFTFALNTVIHGQNPIGFHAVSIVLNGIAAFLVFLVVWTLFRNRTLALFTGIFFAFLPIHTEAVDLMKARDELLSATFALLSWLMFLRAVSRDGAWRFAWMFLSAIAFFLGLLSKEFIVVAPALFFLAYWAQHGIKPVRSRLFDAGWGGVLYGGFLFLYLWMRKQAIPEMSFGSDEIGPLSNVLVMVPYGIDVMTAFKIAFLYISKIFVPIGLMASYHFKAVTLVGNLFYSWRAMLGLVFLITLIIMAIWKKTRFTALGIGALSFLILYFPSSQLVVQGGDIMGERWMYLPSFGMALIAGWVFSYFYSRHKKATVAVFVCLMAFYAAILVPRNLIWRTPLSLFESMIEDSPKSVRGYSALSQYHFEHGSPAKALELVKQGFAISNQEPNLYVVAASIAYEAKEYAKAEELIKQALALDTFSTVAVQNYPRILYAQGKYEEALYWFDGFVSQLPPSKIGFSDKVLYASLLTKMGKYNQSILYIDSRLTARLDHPDVKKLLAVNYYRIGKMKEVSQYLSESDRAKSEEEIKAVLESF